LSLLRSITLLVVELKIEVRRSGDNGTKDGVMLELQVLELPLVDDVASHAWLCKTQL
jgi:hypothetical protein